MAAESRTDPALEAEMDREQLLVDAAIAMVRRGAARRVTIANLPLGDAVLAVARVRAARHGLRVTTVRSSPELPCALVVDADDEDG